MIDVLNREASLQSLRNQAAQTVSEQTPVTAEDGTVSSSGNADSSLVTPVNTPPKDTTPTPEPAEDQTETQPAE